MYQRTPQSEVLLQKLRKLNRKMRSADPDPFEIREFRDLFAELDNLLKSGGILPTSWITRLNFTQLAPHQTHTITDFDPPRQNTPGFAWCGHRLSLVSSAHATLPDYCIQPSCGNYFNAPKRS